MQDVKGGGKSGDACLPAYPQERSRLLSLRILGMEAAGGACRFRRRPDRLAEEGCVLALFPGRAVLQQGGRISEAADPGTQFRFAAGGQGQDEAAVFAVFDLLVGGPDALPYIIGGSGGHTDAERSRFVPGQAKTAVFVIVTAVTDMVPGQLHVLDAVDGQGAGMFDFEPLLAQLAAQHIQGIVHGGHAHGDEAVDPWFRLAYGLVEDPADGLAAGGLDDVRNRLHIERVFEPSPDKEKQVQRYKGWKKAVSRALQWIDVAD